MLRLLALLARGNAARAEQDLADRHALLILDQQIREAAAGVERGRRALGAATAQNEAETRRLAGVEARLADLEERAVAALRAGRDDLAAEAAEAIASLEADRTALMEARAAFAVELARLREAVGEAARRLAELERGRRAARAAEAVARLGTGGPAPTASTSTLAEAEATLSRLRERQAEAAAAEAAVSAVERTGDIAARLEREGFGPRARPAASDVLERLKARASAPASAGA